MRKLKLISILFIFFCLFFHRLSAQQSIWNHNYSKSVVMKLLMAKPDAHGGSKVYCDFEKALEWIKQADNLTLQVPKIIYLVGWQYNGHDDKYPAFFEVNEALKRPEDQTARESLQWLMREARKYHTTVSLHINMTDAYDDSPLWDTYVENDMISKGLSGDLMVIGNYNNRKAYQINYKREWEAGWTQRRIDSLVNLLPELKNAGTIHIDAWIARESKGHQESMIMEADYQKKALHYWAEKGIDVTSEWAMDYMTGLVPFAWHFNHRTQDQYMKIPANIYTGSGINPDIEWSDFGLGFLFGQSMYGEPLWPYFQKSELENKDWDSNFAREFYLNCLQYFFLNDHERIAVEGSGDERVAFFSNDIKVSLQDSLVMQGETRLREKDTILFPVTWKDGRCLALYSDTDQQSKVFKLPEIWKSLTVVRLYEVSIDGLQSIGKEKVKGGVLRLDLRAGQPYVIKAE
ncbi:endo-alpha-N-acetylgalactosaminidase family protein [Echinicola sediminis]